MTREEDLTRIANKLDRMVSRNNTDGALDLLKELKDFNMTLKLLQETRVGMSVNGIRKHCSDREVIALAKFLIKDWKRLLEPAGPQSERLEDKNGLGPGNTAVSPDTFETHSSPKSEDVAARQEVSPEKNHSDEHKGEQQEDHHEDPRGPRQTSAEAKPERPAGDSAERAGPREEPRGDRPEETAETHGHAPRGAACPAPERRADRGGEGHAPDPGEGGGRQQEPRRGRHRDEDAEKKRKKKKRRQAVEPEKREDPEKFRSHDTTRDERRADSAGKDGRAGDRRPERWSHAAPGARHAGERQKERRLSEQRPLFERRGVMDSSVLYPTRYPSPPRLVRPVRPVRPPRPAQPPPLPAKRPSVDVKTDRKRKSSRDSSPRPRCPASPGRRLSLEVKKERQVPPDPNAPLAPLPFHLHPPPTRREPPDPNAPLAPLPFHLHPPPLPKRTSVGVKQPSGEIKKKPSESQPPSLKKSPEPLKKDRKDSSEGKEAKKHSLEVKKERKDSTDLKPPPQKRPTLDVKKERSRTDSSDSKVGLPVKLLSMDSKSDRKEASDSKLAVPVKRLSMDSKSDRKISCDSKAGLPVKRLSMDSRSDRKESCDSKLGLSRKRHSLDSRSDRKESTDSKKASPPPAKKLAGERRESHGSKASHPVRKSSTDLADRRPKADVAQTPPSPASPLSPGFSPGGGPLSPGFSPGGGPLSPRLSTGDTVRDKCIEMLSAALRTDNDFMEFGANCEQMAVDIEDHIYQEIRATDMKYKNRVRSRISNLKDPKNPGLRRNVLAGYIQMTRIASMSAEEMASDELKQLRNVLTQEAIREHQMAKTGGTSTDLLQCSKCRKKNCTYNQVQTRSADEPMTTFVLCNECGNRWKFC